VVAALVAELTGAAARSTGDPGPASRSDPTTLVG
jgi:hypothetical protein